MLIGTLLAIETCRNHGLVSRIFTVSAKPPDGYMWSGERLTKIQATTRLDHLGPKVWSRMSKAAQRKEKQHMGYRETEARQCAKVEMHLFHGSGR